MSRRLVNSYYYPSYYYYYCRWLLLLLLLSLLLSWLLLLLLLLWWSWWFFAASFSCCRSAWAPFTALLLTLLLDLRRDPKACLVGLVVGLVRKVLKRLVFWRFKCGVALVQLLLAEEQVRHDRLRQRLRLLVLCQRPKLTTGRRHRGFC